MTYSEAEQFLYSLSNLPRAEYMSDGKHEDIYLKRMRFFLDILGNPERTLRHVIHVGGTSAKGSLVNLLHTILSTDKKTVGSMISPHPTTLLERWRVNGRHMTKKELVAIMNRLRPALDTYAKKSPYGHLSFFDITTAIGFLFFAKRKVAYAIVEVGCGGEYDSTNTLPKKDIAVITTIGLDHTAILGKTKTAIAKTKAGIIMPGSRVFTMEISPQINRILAKAAEDASAPFFTLRESPRIISQTFDHTVFDYKGDVYTIQSIGKHQVKNAMLAIEISRVIGIPDRSIKAGLLRTRQPNRMHVAKKHPIIILDGAHNPDKIWTTVETLQQLVRQKKTKAIRLIVGYSQNKDTNTMNRLLATLRPASVACTRNTTNYFRTVADPTILKKEFQKALPKATVELFLDPKDALLWTKKHAGPNDIILITGSIFLAGEYTRLLS